MWSWPAGSLIPSFEVVRSPISATTTLQTHYFYYYVSTSGSSVLAIVLFSQEVGSMESEKGPGMSCEMGTSFPLVSIFPLTLTSTVILSDEQVPISGMHEGTSSSSLVAFSVGPFYTVGSKWTSPVFSVGAKEDLCVGTYFYPEGMCPWQATQHEVQQVAWPTFTFSNG